MLLAYFGKVRIGDGRRMEYLRDGEVAIALRYSKKNNLFAIEAGPALTEEVVADLNSLVERNLLEDSGTQVGVEVGFSDVPVTAGVRYRDRFQILPVPSDWPVGGFGGMDHWPFVIEFPFPTSEDSLIAIGRADRVRYELLLVLSALLPWVVDRSSQYGQQQWAFPVDGGPGSHDPIEIRWTQSGYEPQGRVRRRDDFSEMSAQGLERVSDEGVYRTRGRRRSGGEVLDLPSSFENALDRFFALDEVKQERFLAWAYWLNHADLMRGTSSSASYLALIQAVEALKPNVKGGSACGSCGRSTGPSLSDQFRAFVDNYAPAGGDPRLEEQRDELYGLRSALSHGGKLLSWDRPTPPLSHLDPRDRADFDAERLAADLVQIAGINWLLQDGA